MPKKISCMLAALMLMVFLCGCGSIFETEYVSVTDYVPPVQSSQSTGDKMQVNNFNALKQAIRRIAISGEEMGRIVFDAAYDGDVVEDIASACWELRTEDAFCAYCVDNIAYDSSRIVNYYEANIYISYSQADLGNIVNLQYFMGAKEAILEAMQNGDRKIVLLINRSSYTADNIETVVADVYRSNPACAPRMPSAEVNMFSGTGLQRLYEIKLGYGFTLSELQNRKSQIASVQPFGNLDMEGLNETEKAYEACRYLMENCSLTDDSMGDTIYSALVEGSANSEGIAYAYVELCRQLGIECQMIYGQRNWQDHCWNIVRVDGEYYHVDAGVCSSSGLESGFMRRDSAMWENYRWDVSSYPECNGSLEFEQISEIIKEY